MSASRSRDVPGVASDAPLVLFVCAHGAAKSVLAAAEFNRLANAAGLAFDARAAGVEPDATVAPTVIEFLRSESLQVPQKPRRVTEGDIARAWRTITFDLEPTDLPAPPDANESWDGLPSAGEDPEGFLTEVTPRAAALVNELARSHR